MEKCERCQSERVFPEGELLDRDETAEHALNAAVYKDPNAIVFAGKKRLAMGARICADCGHVELYIKDHELDGLRDMFDKRKR